MDVYAERAAKFRRSFSQRLAEEESAGSEGVNGDVADHVVAKIHGNLLTRTSLDSENPFAATADLTPLNSTAVRLPRERVGGKGGATASEIKKPSDENIGGIEVNTNLFARLNPAAKAVAPTASTDSLYEDLMTNLPEACTSPILSPEPRSPATPAPEKKKKTKKPIVTE